MTIEYGDVQIYFEDCVEGMRSRIRTASAQLVLTDPPFGVGFNGRDSSYSRLTEKVVEGYVEVPFEEYEEFSERWLTQAYRILKQNGTCYTFCPHQHVHRVITAAERVGFEYLNQLLYIRPFPLWMPKGWVVAHYNIIMLVKDSRNYKWNNIESYPQNLFYASRNFDTDNGKAPTKLCKKVVYRLMRASSDKGDLVVEPFAGSGVVPYCAYNLDRKCIGFELNTNMRDIIESNFSFDLRSNIFDDDVCPECGAELIAVRQAYGTINYKCSECKWGDQDD